MNRPWIFIIGLIAGSACTTLVTDPGQNLSSLVQKHVDDFNRQDVTAMMGNMHPEFGWYQINGAKMSVEADSPEQLHKGLTEYIKNVPTVRSGIGNSLEIGDFLATIETVSWENREGIKKQQSALSVYEITDNKIKHVWYFPAVK